MLEKDLVALIVVVNVCWEEVGVKSTSQKWTETLCVPNRTDLMTVTMIMIMAPIVKEFGSPSSFFFLTLSKQQQTTNEQKNTENVIFRPRVHGMCSISLTS